MQTARSRARLKLRGRVCFVWDPKDPGRADGKMGHGMHGAQIRFKGASGGYDFFVLDQDFNDGERLLQRGYEFVWSFENTRPETLDEKLSRQGER